MPAAPSPFANALHAACSDEISRAPLDADRCAQITQELTSCLAETVAIMMNGNVAGTHAITRDILKCLPGLIHGYAAVVREMNALQTQRGH